MSTGQLGVIHTKSSYAPQLNISVLNNKYMIDGLFDLAYDHLVMEERKFYHQFFPDVNDIDTFLKRMRELLTKSQRDAECLRRCTHEELKDFIPKEATVFERDWKILITGDIQKIMLKYQSTSQGLTTTMNGQLYLKVVPENIGLIKKIINDILNRKGANKFKDNDDATRNLINFIKNQKDTPSIFKIEGSDQSSAKAAPRQEEFDITQVSKVKFTKDEVDKVLKSGDQEAISQLRMNMRTALYKMKDFLYSRISGGSNELKQAFNETWKQVFPSMGEDMLNRGFFFEGLNYRKSLLGAGGEFYNQVWIRYLNLLTNNKTIQAKIIGDTYVKGQQPHTDLQIMLDCGAVIGFQTKNIDETGSVDVKTNASLIASNFSSTNLVDVLVNSYANTSYGDRAIKEIEEFLADYFEYSMNLNVEKGLDELQTNTFYFISGNNIVPCSEIILHLKNRSTKPVFHISGANVEGYSDDEYEERIGKKKRPRFISLHLWKYPEGHNSGLMVPGDNNANLFERAAKNISISTSFSVSSLLSSKRFELINLR